MSWQAANLIFEICDLNLVKHREGYSDFGMARVSLSGRSWIQADSSWDSTGRSTEIKLDGPKHFGTLRPFFSILLDSTLWHCHSWKCFWHLLTVQVYPLIHSDRPLLVEWSSTSTHDGPHWLKWPSSLTQGRPLSPLWTVHFRPDSHIILQNNLNRYFDWI